MCYCFHPAAVQRLGNVRAYTLAQGALLLLSLWVPHQNSRFISATGSIKSSRKGSLGARVTFEWPYSSPMRIMGTPCDSSSAAARLRIWRCRRRSTLFLAVSPSAPQFQVRLWFSPSLQIGPLHLSP